MMDALEQARREIDTVDAQLAALFERRMKVVLSVAEYKKAHGLPVFDAAREKVVLDKAEARIGDPALRPYYRDHVQNMMDVAKQYEAEVLGRNRAAYQGVEGAFAHIALRALFPHAEAVSCPTWDEVFDAVEKGDAAHGVVPFENSHAGDVSAVLDLCYNHPGLWVVDVYDLPISQNLLVLPGTQLSDLTRVYSHQQAIAQSETFLKQFGLPALPCARRLSAWTPAARSWCSAPRPFWPSSTMRRSLSALPRLASRSKCSAASAPRRSKSARLRRLPRARSTCSSARTACFLPT